MGRKSSKSSSVSGQPFPASSSQFKNKTGKPPSFAEERFMFGILTNAINAALLALVAAAPLLPAPHKFSRRAFLFWVRSGLGIGIGVVLAESGKHFQIWPGRDTFPSGHETLALAAGTCLVVQNPRWLAVVLPLAAVQGWALVAGHFHRPVDVAGALLSGILPPLGCHFYKQRSAN